MSGYSSGPMGNEDLERIKDYSRIMDALMDAIQRQVPVSVRCSSYIEKDATGNRMVECPRCRVKLYASCNYCPNCGQRIYLEEENK